MSGPKVIIQQVDHIAIRSNDPHSLFHFFIDTLQLPIVWPLRYYGMALSGVVCAGNTNIEIFNYGLNDHIPGTDQSRANIFAIAFEPTSISRSLRELTRRTIPHRPPIPSHGKRFDGYQGKLWTNITLDGFLDGGSRSLDISGIIKGNLFFNHLVGNLIGRIVNMKWAESWVLASFGERALFLTEYTHDVPKIRSNGANDLQSLDGGLIGLEGIEEIVLAVSSYDDKVARWEYLLSPIPLTESGRWHLGDGPAIRLIPDEQDEIQTIFFKVKSLKSAEERLTRHNLLGITSDRWVSIAASKIQNLDIRLIE